jgi:hypothetical protein
MIKIEKVVLPSPEQWEAIIRGMRNPKNSWDRSDSELFYDHTTDGFIPAFNLGEKDHRLMDTLNAGGPVHAKYRRMIPVYLDITAPLYWWKEFDTYKVGTVANSCSTMHKVHAKEFTLNDFSREHLDASLVCVDRGDEIFSSYGVLKLTIDALNTYREKYLKTMDSLKNKDHTEAEKRRLKLMAKDYWWQMIQLLPSSYNQKRTVMLNYEVLVGIYKWRKDHKLDEWHDFCKWIESLPYSELITGASAE